MHDQGAAKSDPEKSGIGDEARERSGEGRSGQAERDQQAAEHPNSARFNPVSKRAQGHLADQCGA